MSIRNLLNTKGAFGATLMITGCCIGAGMLGLPVLSVLAGFLPSTLAMFFCYLFTTATGLLLLEATLWFDDKVNLPSIVEATLGKAGKAATLFLFLFLFYCIFVAYLDGGGLLFADLIGALVHHPVSRELGIFCCLGFVAGLTYAGTKIVDSLNRALVFGLVASYLILLCLGLPQVSQENVSTMNLTASLATIPLLLICFGYQNLVPSITYYLKKEVKAIRLAIIIGNFIPFVIYALWNFVILGMLSPGATTVDASIVSELLQKATPSVSISMIVKAFSFFAIITSFLPCALSFIDFLKDGLKNSLPKKHTNLLLLLLVFAPPLVCTLSYPHLFLQALSFAGGFIDVLLFGVLPAAVVLVGRRMQSLQGPYQVAGGSFTPLAILGISLLVLTCKLGAALT